MNKPVKVLEMIASLSFGGSQAMIVNLCKHMDRNKVQCDFIVDHPELMDMKDIVEALGSKIYILPTFNGLNINEVKKAWDEFFVQHNDYDIIHSHSRSYASIYLPIAKKHGLKTIIHSHNTSNGSGIKSQIKNILQLPLRKSADYFFGCSKNAGRWLFGDKIVESDRFHVINNAIDTDLFTFDNNIRKQYRKQFELGDEKVFIQVGRFEKQKNHLFMIDVFNDHLKKYADDKLFLVGTGILKQEIENKINEYQINDNVIILENRTDVNCLLQMADVYLMPSLFEGLSVAAIEAQSTGIRCLCSDQMDQSVDVTGLCEFIALDKNEWLINMSKDLEDRYARKSQIQKAGFDVKLTAEWLISFYKSII